MLSSSANAGCSDNYPFSFKAEGVGVNCLVSKNYLSIASGVPALWAQSSAVITWPNGTTLPPPALGTFNATNTPAVTADSRGDVQLTGGSITTHATGSAAALAGAGGSVELTATTIVTELVDSPGLAVNGSGGSLTATGVIVKTDVDGAFGASNGYGFSPSAGGLMTLTSTNILTQGQDAHAVASGAGSTTILGAGDVLTTQGDGAIGIYATAGGVVTAATGTTTISTAGSNSESTGLSAFGAFAEGSGSQINLAGAMITTAGQGAVGLYAAPTGEGGGGGAITVSGTLSVRTGTLPYAYGAWAQGAGSTIALDGPSTFTINGGAYALYATQGGAITTSDATSGGSLAITVNGDNGGGVQVDNSGGSGAPSSITLKGPTTIVLNGSSDAGLSAATGGALSVQGPTAITVSGPSSAGVAALSSAISITGQLNVNVSQASSAAFALSGVSPSISATGGGTVSTAGNAIEFLNASNATATFDNFNIANKTGDLIFADPSVATVNFNATTANAGNNNLLNATNGSFVTLNANASKLFWRDQDRRCVDDDAQPSEPIDLEYDRVVNNLESRRRQQLRRLHPAQRRRRLQDADPGQLCRFGRQSADHERGAGRAWLDSRPDHHQRRQGDRFDGDRHQ